MAFVNDNNSFNGNNNVNNSQKKRPVFKAKVDKDLVKHRKLKFDELGRTEQEFLDFYAYEPYVEDKKKKKKKDNLLEALRAAHAFKRILALVATKSPLTEMNLSELAVFYMRMCYFPGELMKQGFKSKEQMVDAFYAVFNKLDKSQQQFVETRFQFEVDRLAKSQKLEMTDKTIVGALHKNEAMSNTVIKDTFQYVSTTSIGNYSNKDTYTTTTQLEDQVERMGYSKSVIKSETTQTAASTITTESKKVKTRQATLTTPPKVRTKQAEQDMGRELSR